MTAPKKRGGAGHGHVPAARRRGGGHEEEHEPHENEERWLLTYSDMITLLMVLFIVMFAMSQVDQRKFMQLKTGLAAGFGAPIAMLSGASGMLDTGGSIAPDSVNLAGQAGGKGASQNQDTINPAAVAQLATATEQAAVSDQVKKLQQAQQQLQKALALAGLKNGATFRYDERGLVVSIATDKVLYDNGSAVLKPGGKKILDALGPTLRRLPNQLSIDGHTNSVPIHTAQFPSNWELSSARAAGVLQYLLQGEHIAAGRMSITGYADTRPVIPGTSPQALVVNRRVEIVVLAAVDDAAGRAIAALGNSPAAATPSADTSATTTGTTTGAASGTTTGSKGGR
jgi:chemotaxis protein MotB